MSAAMPGPRVTSVGAAKSFSDGTNFSAIKLASHSRPYSIPMDAERYFGIRRNSFITAKENVENQGAPCQISAPGRSGDHKRSR